MPYFLLGVTALFVGLLALTGLARADIAALARQLRFGCGVAALTAAGVLVLRGAVTYALPLATLGAWLLWGHGGASAMGWPGQAGAQGRRSRVTTAHLEMELDHETGAMRGRVVAGRFKDRDIETLTPAELARLWQEVNFNDPASAQLVEAYLDRTHPSWREDLARETTAPRADGAMSRAEAYGILGLQPGASESDIRRAHRELMQKVHPDHGGSDYLAARINAAKETLLGR